VGSWFRQIAPVEFTLGVNLGALQAQSEAFGQLSQIIRLVTHPATKQKTTGAGKPSSFFIFPSAFFLHSARICLGIRSSAISTLRATATGRELKEWSPGNERRCASGLD
jgi:hypothetical protein